MATAAQRQHARAVMDYLYARRAQFDYPPGDQRTSRDRVSWQLTEAQAHRLLEAGGRLQLDCSETCPWVLRCAGCWHWQEPGYTGSHLELLPIYRDPRGAGVGALVIFGGGTGHHEAIVHTADRERGDPLLFSHGHAGADLVHLSAMAAAQAAAGHPGVRLCSIAHL